MPSLIKYQYFEKQPNLSTIALHGLEDAVRNGQTKVVALTATPNQIEGNFEAPIYTVPFDSKELIRYSVGEVKKYTNLDYLITQLDTSKTGLCYVSRVTKMKELEEKARAHGFNPISIWSIRNTDHIMTEEQLAEWIAKRLGKAGIGITTEAAASMAIRGGLSLNTLANEIEKMTP